MSWITDPIEADPIVWLDAILLKPTSRGSVRLRSADPTEPPRIRLPGLATDADLARIEDGLRFLSSIAHRPEIRGVATEPAPTLPEAAAGLRRYVAENAYSLPHVVGTCAMGPDPTAGAVVDGDARVHGVAGLSVVDASILPDPPSGFPHLITLMAAEHLLDRWIAAG
jgi:choline dehydrogenase